MSVRVLVVDDDVDHADSLCAVLDSYGLNATAAYGPGTAGRMAELFQPEVVILDMHMPGGSGCELLARLRQGHAALGKAVFIAMSADTGAREPCIKAGFDHFFAKPLDLHDLASVIHRLKPVPGLSQQ